MLPSFHYPHKRRIGILECLSFFYWRLCKVRWQHLTEEEKKRTVGFASTWREVSPMWDVDPCRCDFAKAFSFVFKRLSWIVINTVRHVNKDTNLLISLLQFHSQAFDFQILLLYDRNITFSPF